MRDPVVVLFLCVLLFGRADENSGEDGKVDDDEAEIEGWFVEEGNGEWRTMIFYEEAAMKARRGEYFLVAVVTPDSELCNEFIKQLPEVNKLLKTLNSTLKMYTIDATTELNMKIHTQPIHGVPSILLFMGNMNGILYSGRRRPDKIVEFCENVFAVTVPRIDTKEKLGEFERSAYSTVIFVVNDEEDELSDLLKLARKYYFLKFGYVQNGTAASEGMKDYVYTHRRGGQRNSAQINTTEEVETFIKVEARRSLYHFPVDAGMFPFLVEDKYVFYLDTLAGGVGMSRWEKSRARIVQAVYPGFTLVTQENSWWLEDVGNQSRGKYVLFVCNTGDPEMAKPMRYFGITDDEQPRVRLLLKSTNEMFKMEDSIKEPITKSSLLAFLENHEKGNLKAYLKSAELKEDWDKQPLKTLVANNYEEVVLDASKLVIVLLHRKNDLDHIAAFNKLAQLHSNNSDIVIAKMNVEENDIPHRFPIPRDTPSIRSYEKHTNKEAYYVATDNLEILNELIKKMATHPDSEEPKVSSTAEDARAEDEIESGSAETSTEAPVEPLTETSTESPEDAMVTESHEEL